MLTDEDIKKLKEALATKEDLAKILTLEEFGQFQREVKQEFSGLREAIQALTVSVDKLAKAVENMHQEYLALTVKVDRHEKWIQQIAEKLGIKLEY
jgi:predicted  nucleic acid-binding Zn-ribbon protein